MATNPMTLPLGAPASGCLSDLPIDQKLDRVRREHPALSARNKLLNMHLPSKGAKATEIVNCSKEVIRLLSILQAPSASDLKPRTRTVTLLPSDDQARG